MFVVLCVIFSMLYTVCPYYCMYVCYMFIKDHIINHSVPFYVQKRMCIVDIAYVVCRVKRIAASVSSRFTKFCCMPTFLEPTGLLYHVIVHSKRYRARQ